MKEERVYLWKVERMDDWGYDEFDSCVVAAETEEEALRCDPSETGDHFGWSDRLSATLIGEAIGVYESGDIIVASFNAG